MKTTTRSILRGATAIALISATACGDDTAKIDASGTHDVGSGGSNDAGSGSGSAKSFHQVEQLARPAVAEALLFTNDFLNGYNATAPTFSGVDATTLAAVVGEAKTVLKAVYLGTCAINGNANLNADTGFHPGGVKCGAVGTGSDGVIASDGTIATAAAAGASTYADKMFSQFVPDVMRVDTSVTSNYFSLCGDANSTPLLCGGRFLRDDVIDVTYDYLISGAAVSLDGGNGSSALEHQLKALVSDGVEYSSVAAKNVDSAQAPDPTNPNQFHPDISDSFPYSAPPF